MAGLVTQRKRYQELREECEDRYAAIKDCIEPSFVHPFWEQKLEPYAEFGLPLRWDFLRVPGIRGRMYSNPEELDELRVPLRDMLRDRDLSFMEADHIGQAHKTSIFGQQTTYDVLQKAYQLMRLFTETGAEFVDLLRVVEWGGGYGCMAKMLWRGMREEGTYICIDLPVVCVMQWLYLATIFGKDAVNLLGVDDDDVVRGKLNLVPVGNVEKIPPVPADLFIAMRSLSECTAEAVDYVLERNGFKCDYFLLGTARNRHQPMEGRMNLLLGSWKARTKKTTEFTAHGIWTGRRPK
jgi:hypothetical protein